MYQGGTEILKRLAQEYRLSGELCRQRAVLLERDLRRRQREGNMGGMELMRARRRIATLRSMWRDCSATAAYIDHYYEGGMSFERYI